MHYALLWVVGGNARAFTQPERRDEIFCLYDFCIMRTFKKHDQATAARPSLRQSHPGYADISRLILQSANH